MAAAQFAHLLGQGGVLLPLAFQSAVGVEHLKLEGGLQQGLALALPVDVHQGVAELPQRAHGDRLIVDVGVRATGAGQAAREDQLIIGRRAFEDAPHRLAQLGTVQLEASGDAQLVGAGAEQLGRAALAEQKAQRFEQQRLAGAGLSGPGAEARPQFDAHVLDESQVLDEEFSQHRRCHHTGAGAAGEGGAL